MPNICKIQARVYGTGPNAWTASGTGVFATQENFSGGAVGDSDQNATNLANEINNDYEWNALVSAEAVGPVVTVTAKVKGEGFHSYALNITSQDTENMVSSGAFAGGIAPEDGFILETPSEHSGDGTFCYRVKDGGKNIFEVSKGTSLDPPSGYGVALTGEMLYNFYDKEGNIASQWRVDTEDSDILILGSYGYQFVTRNAGQPNNPIAELRSTPGYAGVMHEDDLDTFADGFVLYGAGTIQREAVVGYKSGSDYSALRLRKNNKDPIITYFNGATVKNQAHVVLYGGAGYFAIGTGGEYLCGENDKNGSKRVTFTHDMRGDVYSNVQGFCFDSNWPLTTTGSYIMQWRAQGVLQAYLDKDANFYNAGALKNPKLLTAWKSVGGSLTAYQANVVRVSDLSANRTLALNSTNNEEGVVTTVKDTSGVAGSPNTITVSCSGATIDGAANYVIDTAYGYVTLVSLGGNLSVIGKG